jgi:ABC-2 type transport system ATP-binding protein
LAFPDLVFQPVSERQIRVEASSPIRVGPLVRFLEDQGIEVLEARRRQPSLEDVFVRLTGIETEAMRKEKEKMGGGA